MRTDLERMFWEYVVPCCVCTVVLGFLALMVCKGLDKPEHYELSEAQRSEIVERWGH